MTIGGGSSLAELTLFMEKQQRMQMDRDAQARAERAELEATSKAEKAELEAKFEAKLEAQRLKNERQRQSLERLKAQATEVRLYEQQTTALQARLESLHASKLLSQEELILERQAQMEELAPQILAELNQIDRGLQRVCNLIRPFTTLNRATNNTPLFRFNFDVYKALLTY